MKLLPAIITIIVITTSCSQTPVSDAQMSAFTPVRTVLETNCVHCHGDNRLSTMPPISTTSELARLAAQGAWIVPGKPEASRFFQVVTFPDEIPGAMPPSGHAISKKDAQVLRDWIKAGAKVPAHHFKLRPRGPLPRSV